MKTIFLSVLFLALLSCHKSEPYSIQASVEKYFNPIDLPKLSIDSVDMPSGFFMFQESLAMPVILFNVRVYEFWRRDVETNKLVLLESSNKEVSTPISASSTQIWYCNTSSGGKGKIEINKFICTSEEELLNTINLYTKEMYSSVFVESKVPFAGEKSWVPMDASPMDGSFSVMFYQHNVFIRFYIYITDKNAGELKPIIEDLANQIVDRIDSVAVDKK